MSRRLSEIWPAQFYTIITRFWLPRNGHYAEDKPTLF